MKLNSIILLFGFRLFDAAILNEFEIYYYLFVNVFDEYENVFYDKNRCLSLAKRRYT